MIKKSLMRRHQTCHHLLMGPRERDEGRAEESIYGGKAAVLIYDGRAAVLIYDGRAGGSISLWLVVLEE